MEDQSQVSEEMNKALVNTNSARGVLTFCEWSSGEFDVTNAVTALHRLARASDRRFYSKDPRWPSVIGKAHTMIVHTCTHDDAWPKLSKEYLLNAAWSFSILGHRDEYLFDCICNEVLKRTKELTPNDLSGLARALANLTIQSESVMDKVLAGSQSRIQQFRPPQLASLSWSLATLLLKDNEMMDIIARECISKMRLFMPKQLVDLAWAFGALNVNKPAFNGAVTDATIGRVDEFQPKELAHITHSIATLTAGSEAVMEIIADKLSMQTQDLNPDLIEKIAWAFAATGQADEAVMSSLITEILNRLSEFSPQHLSAIALAFATLGMKEKMLIDAIRTIISVQVNNFRAVDLAKMIPAFVKWGSADEVEGELYAAAMSKMDKFLPRDLVSVAEAYETFGDKELLSQFLEGAAQRFPYISDYANAHNWVELATIVARNADESTRVSFESKFLAAMLRPLLQLFQTVGCPGGHYSDALLELTNFVNTTQLEHLGPHYTRHALLWQCIPVPSACIIQVTDLHAVADDNGLVVASWDLQWRRNRWMESYGRFFAEGVPRSGSNLLCSLTGHKVGAGRHALLHTIASVMKKCPEEKLSEIIGSVRVLAVRFFGIESLAAFCQFRHFFCGIGLEVDYLESTHNKWVKGC